MSQLPLVSILTPAYKANYFQQALDSALAQTYPNIEIIVCDDSHGDDIERICRAAQGQGARLRYQRNAERLGEIGNLTRCLSLAEGTYIKFLYDDDLLVPDCVSTLVRVLEAYPEVVLASSRRRLIDEHGCLLPDSLVTRFPFNGDIRLNGPELVSMLGDYTFNFIGEPSCVLCRRESLTALPDGLFALGGRTIQWVGDLAMYVGLLQHGDLALIGRPLSRFRVSAEQYSAAGRLGDGRGMKWHDIFREEVRRLPCYRGAAENHLVRVGALHGDGSMQSVDLTLCYVGEEATMTTVSLVDKWLNERVPDTRQATAIAERLAGMSAEGRRFLIVVRDFGADRTRLEATLESLLASVRLGAAFQLLLLCNHEPLPSRFDALQVNWILAQPEEYADLLNGMLQELEFDWLLQVQAGEEFSYAGLALASLNLMDGPACRAFFMDEVYYSGQHPSLGLRPDFNLDLLLSMPNSYARHWLLSRAALCEAGGFDPQWGSVAELDGILRLVEQGGLDGLGHLSEALCQGDIPAAEPSETERGRVLEHLHRRGYSQAQVLPGPRGGLRLIYGHAEQPLVSIIIPTKDQLPLLQRCVETLLEKTQYPNYEILIVDNGSETPEARAWLAGVEAMGDEKLQILRYPHPFNYSAMNNLAAARARGEYLLLLNNDTAIIQGDWLEQMLNHALRPEVGIVGAKLFFPDGGVQHAGVLLGLRGPAEHPFIGESKDAPGYMNRLQVDQNYSAVTAACLLIRKSVFEAVGGLDEGTFRVCYNDVDLCLKVVTAGHLIVWTPHARLLHEGSASQRTIDHTSVAEKAKRFTGEQDAMYAKWMSLLAADPAYNRNFSLAGNGFALERDQGLKWHPLSWRPEPLVLAHPADPWGCGNYRVIKPFEALRKAAIVDGVVSEGLLQVADLARLDPDMILLQRQIGDDRLEAMRRIKAFTRAFKVYELDDYLPNLPLKNFHRKDFPKDCVKSLRRGLSYVDRFVVSTDALAEALSGMHPDIRVVKNRLPVDWWSDLTAKRRIGKKPRVGWAGGLSHTGDLELIADVVRDLADEVDWVFMGMCPPELRPYVAEYRDGVEIDRYPARLASLNLDLAIAPVEQNLFNECKSNLRLLEYGACGFPVVCSDVRCYQNELPVTRVKNRYRDWVEAIRMHIADLDATAAAGDRLREQVLGGWMLEGTNLDEWRKAWLPD